MPLIVRPYLNTSPDSTADSIRVQYLLRSVVAVKEEGSIDSPTEALKAAMANFEGVSGLSRGLREGDFLIVREALEEPRFFKIVGSNFQEWEKEGMTLVRWKPKPPTVKTFGYCTEMTLNSMLLDKSIEFYISSMCAGEEISQIHLGTLALENSVGCLKIWNNDSLLRVTIGVLLSAKEFPKPCWV